MYPILLIHYHYHSTTLTVFNTCTVMVGCLQLYISGSTSPFKWSPCYTDSQAQQKWVSTNIKWTLLLQFKVLKYSFQLQKYPASFIIYFTKVALILEALSEHRGQMPYVAYAMWGSMRLHTCSLPINTFCTSCNFNAQHVHLSPLFCTSVTFYDSSSMQCFLFKCFYM